MNTLRRFAIAFPLLVAVFGCATPETKVDLPGGETGYSVSCGNTRSWDACFSKASKRCDGSGYEIVSRSTEVVDSSSPPKEGVYVYPYAERVMVIKCI